MRAIFTLLVLTSAVTYGSINDYEFFCAEAQQVEGVAHLTTGFGLDPSRMVPVEGVSFSTSDYYTINDHDQETTLAGEIGIYEEGDSPGNGASASFEPFMFIAREPLINSFRSH